MAISSSSSSSSATKPISISLFFFIFILSLSNISSITPPLNLTNNPIPTPWPPQFHSILVMNNTGSNQILDLWYDWPNGRNFNIIRKQLGEVLYDLEWNNGTSFYYTLDSNKKCRTAKFEVGILRPNWLEGANYVGQQKVDGFLCNVWVKVDFIWYYEDVVTKRPVHWVFFTGMEAHVMTFEVGAVLEDAKWQAPAYCFEKREKENDPKLKFKSVVDGDFEEGSMEGVLRGSVGL